MSRSWNTAYDWPPETRNPNANFFAHRELVGRNWDDRRQASSPVWSTSPSTGWVTHDTVSLWKSHQQGSEAAGAVPRPGRLAVAAALQRKVIDWTRLGDEDRAQIVRMLRDMASRIAAHTTATSHRWRLTPSASSALA